MASLLSIVKKCINLNTFHSDSQELEVCTTHKYGETFQFKKILIHGRPRKCDQGKCPICMCKRPGYDQKRAGHESSWRAGDLNGVPIYIVYSPHRIQCPEHGVKTEYIPWADGSSRFTADFNNEIAWAVCQASKSAIAEYYGISWVTVGSCMKYAHDRIEPDISWRLHGLRKICVDETSYRVGHNYITVVYDMERNRVVWIHDKHGQDIFEEFCLLLTEKERAQIEVVAGDGASWIDTCTKKYFPNAKRCMDTFHVTEWINEALDKVRIQTYQRAAKEYEKLKNEFINAREQEEAAMKKAQLELENARHELASLPRVGRPSTHKKQLIDYVAALELQLDELKSKDKTSDQHTKRKKAAFLPEQQEMLDELDQSVKDIKGAKYALGHNPENCSDAQVDKIKLIEASYPDLFKAYQLKEELRVILHVTDYELASNEIEKWIEEAKNSGFSPMVKLAEKIERHKENILNTIKYHANSAKSESTNSTIKGIIHMARGFWNLESMMALIYLKCSDLVIPLNNRPRPKPEYLAAQRERANERRRLKRQEVLLR